jgi:hypothetical protein
MSMHRGFMKLRAPNSNPNQCSESKRQLGLTFHFSSMYTRRGTLLPSYHYAHGLHTGSSMFQFPLDQRMQSVPGMRSLITEFAPESPTITHSRARAPPLSAPPVPSPEFTMTIFAEA